MAMKFYSFIFLMLMVSVGLASTIYRYECPKCHLIQEYGVPGIYKCTSDGWTMIPKLGK